MWWQINGSRIYEKIITFLVWFECLEWDYKWGYEWGYEWCNIWGYWWWLWKIMDVLFKWIVGIY